MSKKLYVSSRPEDGNPLKYWDIGKLIELAKNLPTIEVDINELNELNRVAWYGEDQHHGRLTVRQIANHIKRINEADIAIPIILSAEGKLLDGFHRLAKAYLLGVSKLPAKKFGMDPTPDGCRDMVGWLYETYHKKDCHVA